MASEVIIRARKSSSHGKTFEFRFEAAAVNGKRQWISKGGFLTEKDAKRAGFAALAKYNTSGVVVRPSEMSYADFLDYWLENICKLEMKETTLINYEKKIRLHIKPELGVYQISRIKRERIQKFLQDKHDAGYARNTMIVLKGILTKSFNSALDLKYIVTSPADRLILPKTENTRIPTRSAPHVYLTAEQMEVIFNRFPKGTPDHLPLMIGYHCGLRIGEVFALTWNDIDFDKKELTVQRQVQWHQNARSKEEKERSIGLASPNAGYWYFTMPKYKSVRTIELDDKLLSLLRWERDRQTAAEEYYHMRYQRYYEDCMHHVVQEKTDNPVMFICVREDGSYINARTMQYTSKIIHEQLHIPEFDFHSLRHTHATMLVEKDAPLKYVQQRLGHKNIEVTMNIYQHVTERIRDKGSHVMNELF